MLITFYFTVLFSTLQLKSVLPTGKMLSPSSEMVWSSRLWDHTAHGSFQPSKLTIRTVPGRKRVGTRAMLMQLSLGLISGHRKRKGNGQDGSQAGKITWNQRLLYPQRPVSTTASWLKLLHLRELRTMARQGKLESLFITLMLDGHTQLKWMDGVSQMSSCWCEDADHVIITIFLLVDIATSRFRFKSCTAMSVTSTPYMFFERCSMKDYSN